MILIDNTVLSNFALANKLELLQEYCQSNACTTGEILAEFERGIKKGIFIDTNLTWLQKLDRKDKEEENTFFQLKQYLGLGEASCLAIAACRGYDFLSDDMPARKIAQQKGVRLSRSIGVLLRLIEIDKITLEIGNQILKNFIRNGYFSPSSQLNSYLQTS